MTNVFCARHLIMQLMDAVLQQFRKTPRELFWHTGQSES